MSKILSRFFAILLAFAMVVTGVPTKVLYAVENEQEVEAQEDALVENEEAEEEVLDEAEESEDDGFLDGDVDDVGQKETDLEEYAEYEEICEREKYEIELVEESIDLSYLSDLDEVALTLNVPQESIETLFYSYPNYLKNDECDEIIGNAVDKSLEVMDTIDNETIAAILESLSGGSKILWDEFWSGITGGWHEDYQTKHNKAMAKEVLQKYCASSKVLTQSAKDLKESYKTLSTVYDLSDKQQMELFKKELYSRNNLSESTINDIVDSTINRQIKDGLSFANNAVEIYLICAVYIELAEIDMQSIDDLERACRNSNCDQLADDIHQIKVDREANFNNYFVKYYLTDSIMKAIKGEIKKEAINGLAIGSKLSLKNVCSAYGIAQLSLEILADVYMDFHPSVDEIVYSSMALNYFNAAEINLRDCYQKLILAKNGGKSVTSEDIRNYEVAYTFELVTAQILSDYCCKMISKKAPNSELRMDMIVAMNEVDRLTYAKYLKACIDSMKVDGIAVEDSTEEEEEYKENIAAKFAMIQKKYRPNVGQTWTGNYYGTEQCFGFARMVFNLLFGYDAPSAYSGSARYKFYKEDNVNIVGQLVGSEVNEANVKAMFEKGKLGDFIQGCGAPYGQHSMILVGVSNSGITVYDCNKNGECGIYQSTISWSKLVKRYGSPTAYSDNGLSLYRASNYGDIYGDFYFYDDSVNFVIEDGVLIKYNGWQRDVIIPDDVKKIGSNAFKGNTSMYSVYIPDSVTIIGSSAFENCTSLNYVEVPDTVTAIGSYAFRGCSSLVEAHLPQNNQYDGLVNTAGMFANCVRLKRVNIPKTCGISTTTSFFGSGSAPFYNCSSLNDIVFEDGITEIPNCLFQDCVGLKNITIPDSVIRINGGAFKDATNLLSVKLPSKLTTLGTAYGSGATGGTIGSVFSGCKSLESINIPDTVVEIYGSCFINCTSLKEVHLSQRLNRLYPSVFENCVALTQIHIPKSVCKNLNSYLGDGPFKGCSSLKNVEFEEGITDIPNMLFSGCTGIEEVNVPSTVKYVRMDAFKNATNLKKVSLPIGLEIIENYAFYGCKALDTVSIPSTVTTIGQEAFFNCISVPEMILPDGIKSIGNSAFAGCIKLTKAVVPNSVTSIPEKAFYGCNILDDLALSENITSIGNYAFANCRQLKEVTLNKVTMIGDYSFNQCNALENVHLGSGLQKIPQYAFSNCNKLTEVTIPKEVVSIGSNAFANCPNLEKVYIPRKTSSIYSNAFTYPLKIYGIPGTYAETFASVNNHEFVASEIHATDFEIISNGNKVGVGKTLKLSVNVSPENYTDEVTMKSTDTTVLTVTNDGIVTGKKIGKATVKITVGEVSKDVEISVVQQVTWLSVKPSSLTMEQSETSALAVEWGPTNADNHECIWESEDETVATVDSNGVVTAIAEGKVKIYAKAADGFGASAYCTVTVKPGPILVTDIEELQSKHPYDSSSNESWIYKVEGADSLVVTFSSDTEVEQNFDFIYLYNRDNKQVGKYTGKELAGKSVPIEGDTVKIKLVSDDSTNKYGFRVVSVEKKVKEIPLNSITVSPNTKTIEVGDTCDLEVIYNPENTTIEKNVVWSSSNSRVATVTNGVVSAVAPGNAVITAKIANKAATCSIQVDKKLTQISIEPNELSLYVGQKENALIKTNTGKIPFDKVSVSNSDDEVVGVTNDLENGKLFFEAKKPGTSQVEVSVGDVKDVIEITVSQAMLHFLNQDGTDCDIEDVPIVYGQKYPVMPTLSKTGYTFEGWFTKKSDGVLVNDEKTVESVDAPHNVFARWNANKYTLTFDTDDVLEIKPVEIEYESVYGEKLPVPVVAGITFLGWFTEKNGGTEVHKDDVYTLLTDQTLYARWKLKYTVENPMFSVTSGTPLEKGSKVSISTATTDAEIYYSMDGEDPVISEETRYEDAIVITEPVTIKAIAVKEHYKDSDIVSAAYTIKDESEDWGEISEEDKSGFTDANDVSTNLWVKGIADADYTGKPITFPDLRVYKGKELLKANTDYTVAYKNNTKAGTATVTITGKGNYAGTIVKTFEINKVDLGSADAADITLAFNNRVQKGTTTVTINLNGVPITLKANTDFKYVYPNTDSKAADFDENAFKVEGNHTVKVEGNGNFTGTTTFTETITTKPLISKMTVKGLVAKMPYTGSAITQDNLEVWDGKTKLTEGEDADYTVSYGNNTEIGKATIVITGKGDYIGTKTVTFDVTGYNIKSAVFGKEVTGSYPYTGSDINKLNPETSLTYKKSATDIVTLKGIKKSEYEELLSSDNPEKRDYDYTYEYSGDTVNVGRKGTIIIQGINSYTGTVTKTFSITAKPFDADIEITVAPATYQKGGSKPAVTVKDGEVPLTEGVDYTVTYSNNTKVHDGNIADAKAPTVKITGKGNYKGILSKKYPITPSDIANVTVTASDIVYQNKAGICKPKITVTDTDGKNLTAGTDYEKDIKYTYLRETKVSRLIDAKKKIYDESVIIPEGMEVNLKEDIIQPGTEIKVSVTGKGNYAGADPKETTFRFVSADISKATVTVTAQNYTGRPVTLSKDDITVKIGKDTLKKTDYEIVGYNKNTAKGSAEVIIKGVGKYGGTKTAKFNIVARNMNYTVEYNANADDATGSMKTSLTALNGKVTANAFKRQGYTFAGWSFEPDGEVVIKNSGALVLDSPKEYGSTITLYAQWKK